MDDLKEKYIGYLKYSGVTVAEGLLDIRKSAEALLGFDEILRYFIVKEEPTLIDYEFEIPVRIRKGSWEALIPEIVDKILSPGGIASVAATTYAVSMARKAGSDGLFQTGLAKDIKLTFATAIKAAQWVIKIASHVGGMQKKSFDNAKLKLTENEIWVEILNEGGEILKVPHKYFEYYLSCPENIFSKNASIIDEDKTLEFGVFEDNKPFDVKVPFALKHIFIKKMDNEESELVLPELKHGQYVELEGEITRATESVNTIGFRYNEHIIICKPQAGNIAKFKSNIVSQEDDHLFPRVRIIGIVDRTDKNGEFKEKRPQIFFSKITPLENLNKQKTLFE